jgi:hypothetical protein
VTHLKVLFRHSPEILKKTMKSLMIPQVWSKFEPASSFRTQVYGSLLGGGGGCVVLWLSGWVCE